ncbi:MAG: hydantoinase/oxoprolinase family protein [Oscillospiraceae bacterium]|nr:hydantoinase/oxoprolinase family protein [Oscillospiraceae bacterium]
MKIGIGIDTGGTYTDAVIYRFETKEVLSAAKALTTKNDLSVGIVNALRKLDQSLLPEAEVAALSTTLATNACVEGKGGRAKLLFLGLDDDTLRRVGGKYGLDGSDEVHAYPGAGSFDGQVLPSPDWERITGEAKEWLADADGLGIVELYAMNNGAVAEREAKERLLAIRDLPTVCSSELFNGLNSVQRGSGTLLNAKLVPIIREFMDAVTRAFRELGIRAPVVIVRSDGSLMSESFSRMRPVETILCGPAASVLGGVELAGRRDSVIVDMGGTTTDVSLVKDGRPVRVRSGIQIGSWRTFVRGVQIDTFGLGGDSAVRLKDRDFELCTDRVLPLSLLGKEHPEIVPVLQRLLDSKDVHTRPIHEFYTLVRDIGDQPGYTAEEKAFCAALRDGPLDIRSAAAAVGTDIYWLKVDRLEAEGVVLRSGLTPTDFMHLKGDFDAYDPTAADIAARYLLRCMNRKLTDKELSLFCDEVYERVKKKLYCSLTRILLMDRYPNLREEGVGPQLERIIERRWEDLKHGRGAPGYFETDFTTRAALVGIGAPIHIFLPDVARALGAECIIPPNAGVANAVGAVVGNISAEVEVELRPNHTADGIHGYFVRASDRQELVKDRKQAAERCRLLAAQLAREEAKKRGVTGDIRVTVESEDQQSTDAKGLSVDLGTLFTATAIGGMVL